MAAIALGANVNQVVPNSNLNLWINAAARGDRDAIAQIVQRGALSIHERCHQQEAVQLPVSPNTPPAAVSQTPPHPSQSGIVTPQLSPSSQSLTLRAHPATEMTGTTVSATPGIHLTSGDPSYSPLPTSTISINLSLSPTTTLVSLPAPKVSPADTLNIGLSTTSLQHPSVNRDSGLANMTTTSIPLSSSTGTEQSEMANAVSPAEARSGAALALKSSELDISSLTKANGLRDVIKQVENGHVAEMRKKYGPVHRRPSNSQWESMKIAVTRRERLYLQLTTEFGGDQEAFFRFFTISAGERKPRHKRKRDAESGLDPLRPLRLVVEAIPHRDRDLQKEQSNNIAYRDPTTQSFSHDLWDQQWGGQNRWEIWRALGKEQYR